MPLTFLLTQTSSNWILTEATEKVVIFKPIVTSDPTASISFVPREDNPEKVYAILQGKGLQQDLFIQKEIKPKDYLSVAAGMHEIIFSDEGFDL
jgi:hypothetical protein